MHWTEKSKNTTIIVGKFQKPKIKLEQTHKLRKTPRLKKHSNCF